MTYPPRLSHLVTQKVLVAKLYPTFAAAHQIDDDEARDRLSAALKGALLEQLLEATWAGLTQNRKRLDDEGLLEKVARSLKDNPFKPAKEAKLTPGLSAFLVLLDLEAGTATDAVRKVLESPEGSKRALAGMAEAGAMLAAELSRK